jgi:di/tricarboxylate transporter
MLGGALAMILANLLRIYRLHRAVEWKSVFLVAGMLPMGIASPKLGLATQVAEWLWNELGTVWLIIIATLFVLALLLTQVMNELQWHRLLFIDPDQPGVNLDPRSIVMAVALATSIAFITPLGHPVNVLVMA